MDNTTLNISFGVRPKRPCSFVKERRIGKNISNSFKKINPSACDGIIGKTFIGKEEVTVSINPNNFIIDVEPKHLRDEILKKLETSFSNGKRLRHKHEKPRHKSGSHNNKTHKNKKYSRTQHKKETMNVIDRLV